MTDLIVADIELAADGACDAGQHLIHARVKERISPRI